jgi:hypothetical protein
MTRNTVLHQLVSQDHVFGLVESCDLGRVDDGISDDVRSQTGPKSYNTEIA